MCMHFDSNSCILHFPPRYIKLFSGIKNILYRSLDTQRNMFSFFYWWRWWSSFLVSLHAVESPIFVFSALLIPSSFLFFTSTEMLLNKCSTCFAFYFTTPDECAVTIRFNPNLLIKWKKKGIIIIIIIIIIIYFVVGNIFLWNLINWLKIRWKLAENSLKIRS